MEEAPAEKVIVADHHSREWIRLPSEDLRVLGFDWASQGLRGRMWVSHQGIQPLIGASLTTKETIS